jgi:septal ring factor EnvC (AmiA/AmiB activator)
MANLVPETEMREIIELNARINLLLAMSSLADSELAQKNEEIKLSAEKIRNLERQVIDLERQVIDLERQVIDAELNTQAILSSTSWQITAPLRWLRKKIEQ